MATFFEKVNAANQRIGDNMERMLATGLLQPMASCESSSRSLMYATHRSHILTLLEGEKAIIETGYEIRYGDLSSSDLIS